MFLANFFVFLLNNLQLFVFLVDGPKLKVSPLIFCFFLLRHIASAKYPFITSKTCCQGLVEERFLILTGLFLDQALTQSGINLSFDQSPPPITFPALATAKDIFLLIFKYDS